METASFHDGDSPYFVSAAFLTRSSCSGSRNAGTVPYVPHAFKGSFLMKDRIGRLVDLVRGMGRMGRMGVMGDFSNIRFP